jgi:alpha-mannosidase
VRSPWKIANTVPMHNEFIPMAAVAMASIGAFSQQMGAGKAHEQAMQQYGIQQAVNDVDQAIAQASLVQEASTTAQQAKGTELQIEQQEAATIAQAEVNAAAAGVEGNSVDITQAELEASAGRAQGNLQIQTDNAYNAIDQQSRDIAIGKKTAEQLAPNGPNQAAGMLNIFNSGLSAYLGAR